MTVTGRCNRFFTVVTACLQKSGLIDCECNKLLGSDTSNVSALIEKAGFEGKATGELCDDGSEPSSNYELRSTVVGSFESWEGSRFRLLPLHFPR